MNSGPNVTERKLRNIQSGIGAVLTAGKTLPLHGANLDATALGQVVANALAPYESVTNDRQDLRVSVANRRSRETSTKELIKEIQAACLTTFGEASSEYQSFGFMPRKKAALTSEQQALKHERALATRQARGTKGKRQKASIHGTVTPQGTTAPATGSPGAGASGSSPAAK
ncbi:MAG TPA: hypothetical protein VFF73_08025 [Planctomycetota bacterium]|nr:hypothetical protein [Planctomycetota bacterium]